MRDDLLQCLLIQPFPSEMLKRRRACRDMKNDKIEVFCTTCRPTEDEDMSECVWRNVPPYVHQGVQYDWNGRL